MQIKNFKKGDKVYCVTNYIWGKVPMIVTSTGTHDYIFCKHPLLGDGGFFKQDLVPYLDMPKTRRVQLKEYNRCEVLCKKLRKKLFED